MLFRYGAKESAFLILILERAFLPQKYRNYLFHRFHGFQRIFLFLKNVLHWIVARKNLLYGERVGLKLLLQIQSIKRDRDLGGQEIDLSSLEGLSKEPGTLLEPTVSLWILLKEKGLFSNSIYRQENIGFFLLWAVCREPTDSFFR